ncbi:MAG TPA: hypothetical protein VF796_17130 [Humisphaera sp.]
MTTPLIRRAALIVPALGLVLAAAGCSSSGGPTGVTLSGADRTFSQSFPVGVADVQDDGNTDVVVTTQTASSDPACPAVRQVVHVRTQWQQAFRLKREVQEVSRNAVIRWYVTPAGRPDAAGKPQVVEYAGSGLVEVKRDGDEVRVTIREAKLEPVTVTTKMADPVGPATLSGTFVARRDRGETIAQIGELRATVAAARSAPTGAEAKLPLGQ